MEQAAEEEVGDDEEIVEDSQEQEEAQTTTTESSKKLRAGGIRPFRYFCRALESIFGPLKVETLTAH